MLERVGETDLFKSISDEMFLEFYGKKDDVETTDKLAKSSKSTILRKTVPQRRDEK